MLGSSSCHALLRSSKWMTLTLKSQRLCSHTCSHRRVLMSQTRMVLSAEAEKRRGPETSTDQTISS